MKPGRNDPCPCGSGKKYKKCCQGKSKLSPPAPEPIQTATLTPAECNQIVALANAGRHDELEAQARLLTEKYPDSGLAWQLLGIALRAQGKDALPVLQRVVQLLPDDAAAHNSLGIAQQGHGQLDDAVASFRRALRIKPDFAEAHSNLGNALRDSGQPDDAVASYRRALALQPEFPDALFNMGISLVDLGQLDAAMASYRRALALKPDFAEAHSNLGIALQHIGQLDAALASYSRALEIDPGHINAHSNRLFIHNFLFDQPAESLLADARRFGELVARQAHPYTSWRNVPEPNQRLRVGLVSGDLRGHPVGYFVEGVLAALASDAAGQLEFVAYPSSHACNDALSDRIKSCCRGWHSTVGLSDESLARRIRDDGIDILLDLSGHTAHNRLPMFAWKPAPVQASWLGYFATTGVDAIDYLIADPWTLPVPEECRFTEKIWRLPETRLCFTPPDVAIEVAPLPALKNSRITFGCFNNLTKMNDAVVALWGRILAAVPHSRLFLKAHQFSDARVRQSVLERFGARGIDAARLMLEGFDARNDYLAAYHRVDIALDPFPFPGGTTTVESLWMGVPVLTLTGERFVSRQSIGLLMNAGLPDWIAADTDDYAARAVAQAGDLQRLAALRKGLRQQVRAAPLFDARRFAAHFENALRGMWQQWCQQRAS